MTDKEAVLAANQSFYRAFEKKDLNAMSNLWSQGVGSLCVHPGREALRGWGQVYDSWVKIFSNTNYLEIETEIITVEVSDAIAYVVLIETVLQVIGGRKLQARSMATNVFERMVQKWYLVHHHGSPIA